MLYGMETPRLLAFPCDYPIKVMMRKDTSVRAAVDAVFAVHGDGGVVAGAIERRSAQGNFSSVTYTLRARDEQHIAALFADLKAVAGVLMVL
jgi:putative lipoic acid-binding regulatory protein